MKTILFEQEKTLNFYSTLTTVYETQTEFPLFFLTLSIT